MTVEIPVTLKLKETESNKIKNAPKRPQQKGDIPSGVVNFVTEKIFLWLGVDHNRQSDTKNQL